jgi:hypothetical protein
MLDYKKFHFNSYSTTEGETMFKECAVVIDNTKKFIVKVE